MKNYLYALLAGLCLLSTFSGCDEAEITVPDEVQGTWRLQQVNYVYRNGNGQLINALEEGSAGEKQLLYQIESRLKPMVATFGCNFLYVQDRIYSLSGVDYTIKGNELTINSERAGVFYELVTNSAQDLLYSFSVEKVLLVFKRGGYEDKDEDNPIDDNQDNENPDDDLVGLHAGEFWLQSSPMDFCRHPYETALENRYDMHKDRLLVLFADNARKICLGHKDGDLWLLVYEKYDNHWHILRDALDNNDYWNSDYIFFEAGHHENLSDITEKRQFNSGNGRTPVRFGFYEENAGYVVGFKDNGMEKFVRIRAKNRLNDGFLVEYSPF
ncbi:MAG: hypothetical protein LBN18_05540 [Dysgonamonadaceae bacterium]|nr:hypothetical protein [Dysgonamonadaceae bacterium]